MKTTFVFDACAMIAYLRDEKGAEAVEKLFFTPQANHVAHILNVCEVFYDFLRTGGEEEAQRALSKLKSLGLHFDDTMDADLWQEAGRIKATFKRVSLADCFALALAKRDHAILVTSDHHEFDKLVNQNICLIYFIR